MSLRILIVDDSAVARSIVKRSLEICGLRESDFWEAGNGREALDILRSWEIDLVFTDLNMPKMSGDQLLKHIKASPKLFEIPVVIISSMSNQKRESSLLKEHALAVLQKPVSLPQINQVLNEKLGIL